jgi:hypothetical protein
MKKYLDFVVIGGLAGLFLWTYVVLPLVRVVDEILDFAEIDDIAEKMRNYTLSRHGEQAANVVIVQGSGKETLRLFGDPHAKTVRAALFNAAVSWSPLTLD